jgi:hypothetical protein
MLLTFCEDPRRFESFRLGSSPLSSTSINTVRYILPAPPGEIYGISLGYYPVARLKRLSAHTEAFINFYDILAC